MGSLRAKIDYVLKHYPVIYSVFFFLGSAFFRLLGVFIPLRKKRVLLTAHGRLYNDSPRVIYEYMINHKEYDDYELIWGLENPDRIKIPGRAKKIQIDTLKYFVIALSSKYWITCVNIERGLKFKPRNTIYLNTWHGYPIKGDGITDKRKAENLTYINYFCAASEFDKHFFERCFSIPSDHFLLCGFPRMDELYNVTAEETLKIKEKMGLPNNKKIILYAPTWRDSGDLGKTYSLKPPINMEKWRMTLGHDYIVLLRMHPYTTKLLGLEFDSFLRDFSSYPNVNEILKVSDILISDYSGIFFEYSVLERPLICFGYDLEQYKDERGLSIDLEKEMPSGVLKTEDDVLRYILGINYLEECKKTRKFKNTFIQYGGNATKICLDTLFQNARENQTS